MDKNQPSQQGNLNLPELISCKDSLKNKESHDGICKWTKDNAEKLVRKILNWCDDWNPSYLEGIVAAIRKNKSAQLSEIYVPKPNNVAGLSALEAMIAAAADADPSCSLLSDKSQLNIKEDLYRLSNMDNPPPKKLIISVCSEKPIHSDSRKCRDPDAYVDVFATVGWNLLNIAKCKSPSMGYYWLEYPVSGIELIFEIKPVILRGELFRQLGRYSTLRKGAQIFVVSPDVRYIEEITSQGYGFISFSSGEIFSPMSRGLPPLGDSLEKQRNKLS